MNTPQELTQQYKNGTLPEGDYYFECGNHIHKGHFYNPDQERKDAAKVYNQNVPVQTLITFEGRFVGVLQTVNILAPIPDYKEFMALNQFAKGA